MRTPIMNAAVTRGESVRAGSRYPFYLRQRCKTSPGKGGFAQRDREQNTKGTKENTRSTKRAVGMFYLCLVSFCASCVPFPHLLGKAHYGRIIQRSSPSSRSAQ